MKRFLSLMLAFVMCLGLFQLPAFAENGSGASKAKKIDQSTYDALGLIMSESGAYDDLAAPYSKTGKTSAFTASEVYLTSNGTEGNVYTLRDGLNRMDLGIRTDRQDDYGQLSGAYAFYGLSNSKIDSKKGNTIGSYLSDNRGGNVIAKTGHGFSGIYATSVAFNGGDGRDNYVAELRAYGGNSRTWVNGSNRKGAIEVEIHKIGEDGSRNWQRTLKPTLNTSMLNGDALTYFCRRYVQELDAMFEIEAADVNGDGKDEIFVYCGAYEDESGQRNALVDVFPSGGLGTKSTLKISGGPAGHYSKNGDWWHLIKKHPVVTLAGGDIDRDNKDEIAVTISAPTDHGAVKEAGRCTVYTNEGKGTGISLKGIPELTNLSLAAPDGKGMVSANCAFGNFQLPNTSIVGTALLIGGYQTNKVSSAANSGTYWTAAYRFAYYNPQEKRYVISDYNTQTLGSKSGKIASSYKNEGESRYRPTHAPLPLACADLEGWGAENNDNEILFGGEVYKFNAIAGIQNEIGSISLCGSQVHHANRNKDKEQVWIGDVVVGCVDSKPHEKGWRESFLCVVGTHRDEKLNGDDDYYWMDLAGFWLEGEKKMAQSGQEGVIAQSNKRNDQYGTFVSLCLPDVDNDSVIMEYESQYMLYSEPEVYAVLQASPYFSDLAENYDYIGNGGTSYGTTSSTGRSLGASISQSVGTYMSAEVQLGAGAEMEAELSASFSYDYSNTREIEHEVIYNNQAGTGDKVVVYTVPYIYYVYNTYNPVNGKWGTTVLPAVLNPVTTILDLETYDEIAAETDGLSVISGNLLHSTPGEPETYVNKPGGTTVHKGKGYVQSNNNEGADISKSITCTETNEHNFEVGLELNLKVGAGAALLGNELMAGVTSSTYAGFTSGVSSSKGTIFTGTVDNLPKPASSYSFSWDLTVNEAEIDKEKKIWIVGYDVIDVKQPPKMPRDLTITEVGTNSISMEWEPSDSAAYYVLSMVDSMGNYNEIATLPYTTTDYTKRGLEAKTNYKFSVRSVSATKGSSINTPIVAATTMSGSANFELTESPENLEAAPGKEAIFQAGASYWDKNGQSKTPKYEWQFKTTEPKAEWSKLIGPKFPGASSMKLQFPVTIDMNGWEFRCRIYADDQTLYTKPAKLTVGKSASKITLDSSSLDDKILSASGNNVTTSETTVTGRAAAAHEKDGKLYSLVTNQTEFYWFDGADYYAYKGDKPELTDGIIGSEQTFNDNIGDKKTVSETDYKATIGSKTISGLAKQDEVGELTITYDGLNHTPKSKWTFTDADNSIDYSFYETEVAEGDTKGDTEYLYSTDDILYNTFSLDWKVKIGDVEVSTLGIVFQETKSTVISQESEAIKGESYTLKASPTSAVGGSELEGKVTFAISGTGGETINADLKDGQYTGTWTPKAEGKFTVTAVFAGNESYKGSISEPITVYAVMAIKDNIVLDLTAPANVTYGNSANIAVTEITYADKSSSVKDMTQKVTYTVKKLVNRKYVEANAGDYTLDKSSGLFTPKIFTNFQITAENDGREVSATIIVSKGSLIITAQDTEKPVNDSEREPKGAVTSGGASWDDVSMTGGQDYKLTSEGEKANVAGVYPITVTLLSSPKIKDLQQRYNIHLRSAEYTLTSTGYAVTANAGSNGNVTITSEIPGSNVAVPVSSGDNLPETSKVTITATPNAGYVVSGWKVGGNYLLEGNSYITDSIYTIDSLEEVTVVGVEFTPGVNKLTFMAADGNGTVTAKHLNGGIPGESFTSGENVNFNQTIRLSAQPKDDHAIEKWEITRGDETVKLLAADGVSDFTGNTYDLSRFNKDTAVKVFFVKDENPTVKINPVDKDQNPFSNVIVSVNGTPLSADNGIYSYVGKTGDNVSITVTPTDGLLVQEWNVGASQTTGTLSNNNQTMTLYNLRSNIDFTVVCAALNDYQVSFEGALDGEGAVDSMGSVTASKIGAGKIDTGSRQLKGSTIQFTATAADGYEIMGWKLSGQEVTASRTDDYNIQTYQIPNLNANENLIVSFRAKPTVSWLDGIGGTVAITGTKYGQANEVIENASYVDYGTALIVTVTPSKGYTADDLVGVTLGEAPHDSDVRTGDIIKVEENITLISTFTALDEKDVSYSVVPQSGEGGGYHGTLKAAASRKDMASYNEADTVGTTNGSRMIYEGGEITLTTVADTGYRVKEWHVDGEKYKRDGVAFTESVLLLPYEDLPEEITVQFEKGDARITFLDPEHGTLSAISASEKFESGGTSKAPVVFTVSFDENYVVKQWTVNGEVQIGKTDSTFTYKPDSNNVTVTVELQGKILVLSTETSMGGTVGPAGMVRYGESVTLHATVNTGYTFDGWYLNNDKVSENVDYTFTAYAGGVYQARFAETSGQTVTFKVSNEDMGTISATAGGSVIASGSEVEGGKEVEITVTPKEGYRFQQWTGQLGSVDKNNCTATFIMGDKNIDLIAVLEEIPIYEINILGTEHGTITAQVDKKDVTQVSDGTEVIFTATAEANWMLDQWTDDARGQTGTTFTIPVSKDLTVGATFKDAVNYTVDFSVLAVDGNTNGSISGKANDTTISANTEVQCVGGSRLVFTAQPDTDFMVKEWQVDGEVQEDNLSNTLILENLSKNTKVTVEYEELKLHDIPQSGLSYEIIDVTRTPNDYGTGSGVGGADQIRGRGTVTFTVIPQDLGDESGYMSKLIINGYNCITETETGSYVGGKIVFEKNENGSYTITVSGVTQDIIATLEANKVDINEGPNEYFLSKEATGALKGKLEIAEDEDLAAAIKQMLSSEVAKINVTNNQPVTHYEVTLQKREGGKWVSVTDASEFPTEGLNVVLPYPAGAGSKDSYTIAHMYITATKGHSVGDVEIFTANGTNKYTAKADGIHIHIDSLSPFAIGWTKHTIAPKPPSGGGGGIPSVAVVHTIEAVAAVGGTITPSGIVSVKDGKGQTFVIQADAAYLISDVLVDGKSVGAVKTYTFERVKENHTILVNFIEESSLIGTGVADWLETDKHIAYLGGYLDGSFRPDNNMSRAEVAQMFYGLLLNKDVAMKAKYSDVPADAWYETAVNTLTSIGVISGVGGNQFAPDRSITRAEFTAIAMRFAKVEITSERVFSDVSPSDWFYRQVSGAIGHDWISGYSDGSFRPNASITRAEAATIVNRMLDRSADLDYVRAHEEELHLFSDVARTSWAYYVILEATNAHEYSILNGKEIWNRLH